MKPSLDSASIQFKGIYVIRAQKVQLSAVGLAGKAARRLRSRQGTLMLPFHSARTENAR